MRLCTYALFKSESKNPRWPHIKYEKLGKFAFFFFFFFFNGYHIGLPRYEVPSITSWKKVFLVNFSR